MNNELEFQQARLNEIVSTYTGRPIVVVLEGRDSAGKSGTIRELTHFLPTKEFAIVTTNKPTKSQKRLLELRQNTTHFAIFAD